VGFSKSASSTLLSALFEGPSWRAVHDGGSDEEGALPSRWRRGIGGYPDPARDATAVALSRSGGWLAGNTTFTRSLSWFPVFSSTRRPVLL